MRLAEFITTRSEAILTEWIAFAATCGPAGLSMDRAGLRDHAAQMLARIVHDLGTPQTDAEQIAKSKGLQLDDATGPDTAAEVHGADRAESGFTIGEMVSEYRALRASVLRLWTAENGTLAGADVDDLMRFNEAIDQALAESVTRYTSDLERSREMFVAILGHDLRTPLSAVMQSAQFFLEDGKLGEPYTSVATRIGRSARRMNGMVDDLLDFTRSRFGSGVPIQRRPMHIGEAARLAIDELSAASPGAVLELHERGDLRGSWDAARMSQVLANLLGNAIQHGVHGQPITVTVAGDLRQVELRVHNRGPVVPAPELREIFSPFKRLRRDGKAAPDASHLGLGLYIAERVVTAHDGSIGVTSTADDGTTFVITLPR